MVVPFRWDHIQSTPFTPYITWVFIGSQSPFKGLFGYHHFPYEFAMGMLDTGLTSHVGCFKASKHLGRSKFHGNSKTEVYSVNGCISQSINVWLELSQIYWYKQGYCTGVSVYQCLFCQRSVWQQLTTVSVICGKQSRCSICNPSMVGFFLAKQTQPKTNSAAEKERQRGAIWIGMETIRGQFFRVTSMGHVALTGTCFRAYSVLMLFVCFSALFFRTPQTTT